MRAWRSGLRLGAALAWLAIIVLGRVGVRGGPPERLVAPVADCVAALVQGLLRWTGIDAARAGARLFIPGAFGYEVGIGCTGLLPAAVLALAMLATPATPAARWRGVALGIPLVLAVNLLRLVHLFYLGVYRPGLFAPAHTVVWEAAIVFTTFATWLVWSRWAAVQRRATSPESS